VVSVSAARGEGAGSEGRNLVEALLVDCSQSMDGDKLAHAKDAIERTIDLLPPDAWFCVIAGSGSARVPFPLSQAPPTTKRAAKAAVRQLRADGGTAMSTWLEAARLEFRKVPGAIHHALLLTDGKNEGEPDARLAATLQACEGEFQCDARGV